MDSQFIYVNFDDFFSICYLNLNSIDFHGTVEYLQTFSYLFSNENLQVSHKDLVRRISEISLASNAPNSPMDNLNLPSITSSMFRLI